MVSLKSMGVQSISLNYNKRSVQKMGGAEMREQSTFTFRDSNGQIKKGQIRSVKILDHGEEKGYVLFGNEETASRIMENPRFRIMAVLHEKGKRPDLLRGFLRYLSSRYPSYTVEIFICSDHWDMAADLAEAGFRLTHNAMTLHLHLS